MCVCVCVFHCAFLSCEDDLHSAHSHTPGYYTYTHALLNTDTTFTSTPTYPCTHPSPYLISLSSLSLSLSFVWGLSHSPFQASYKELFLFGGWNGFSTLYGDTWTFAVSTQTWYLKSQYSVRRVCVCVCVCVCERKRQ